MPTKPINIGDSPEMPRGRVPWSSQLLVILATLILLGFVFGVWQISKVEPPRLEEVPETPMPAPVP